MLAIHLIIASVIIINITVVPFLRLKILMLYMYIATIVSHDNSQNQYHPQHSNYDCLVLQVLGIHYSEELTLQSSVTPGNAVQHVPLSNKRQKLSQQDAIQNAFGLSNTDGQQQSGDGQQQSGDGQHQLGDGPYQSVDGQQQSGDGQHQSDAAQRPRVIKVIRLHGINVLCALDRRDEDSFDPGQWHTETPSFALGVDS